jgi:hypothetical protein
MREKSKISLVVADVDGTLVTEQKGAPCLWWKSS